MTIEGIEFYVLDVKYLGNSFTLIVNNKNGNNDICIKIPIIGAKLKSTGEMIELFTDRVFSKDIGVPENKLTYLDTRKVSDIDLDDIREVLKYIKKGYNVIYSINDKFDNIEIKIKEIYQEYINGLEENNLFITNKEISNKIK